MPADSYIKLMPLIAASAAVTPFSPPACMSGSLESHMPAAEPTVRL